MHRLLLAALLCLPPMTAWPTSVRDDSGIRVELAGPAQRVISLAPNLTELVYAAGGGTHLIAVSRYSDFPAPAQRLPIVGDVNGLDLEAIARLKPDLVLVWRSGMPARQRERLRTLGLKVYESEISSVSDISRTLLQIGTLLGTSDTARAAAQTLDERWARLRAGYSQRQKIRVLYEVWDQPLMTISRRHLIHEAIVACGGINPFADLPGLTPTISWEAAVQANPELIVTGNGGKTSATHAWSRFQQVRAVQTHQVIGIQADWLTRMGPRFLDGAQSLCVALEAVRRQASSRAAQPPASATKLHPYT